MDPLKFIRGKAGGTEAGDQGSGFGYSKVDLQSPALNFVLNEFPFTSGGSLSHLGIQVDSTDDVLRPRERWIGDGLRTVDEMKVDRCHALQDKTWARDPDGNLWEVFVVLENTEPKDASCSCGTKGTEAKISTAVCCIDSQKASTIGATNQACC